MVDSSTQVFYDHSTSGLTATNVKTAIDELNTKNGEKLLVTSASIDLKTVAQTLLYAVPSNVVITKAVLQISSSAITIPATVSIGSNVVTYDNAIPSTVLGITGTNKATVLHPDIPTSTGSEWFTAGAQIKFNVSVGATGVSQFVIVKLFGVVF